MQKVRRFHLFLPALALGLWLAGCTDNASHNAQSNQSAGNKATGQESSGDRQITTNVESKFFTDPAIKAQHINVSTDNGVVTLDGSVASDQLKQHAQQVAQSVSGVKQVNDKLQVASEPQPTATSGQASAEGSNAGQPAGNAGATNEPSAGTSGQTMPVVAPPPSGSRPSAAENATPPGAGSSKPAPVVAPPPSGGNQPAPGAENQARSDDSWIQTQVESKFFMDDQVKSSDVNVTSSQGVVTLSGTVPSEQARQEALQLARGTDGVKQVVDQLKVQGAPSAPIRPR